MIALLEYYEANTYLYIFRLLEEDLIFECLQILPEAK